MEKEAELEKKEKELPYERFLEKGAQSLSDAELLAIIIRSGIQGENSVMIAKKILEAAQDHTLHGLLHLNYQDLVSIRGIGKVKAVKLLCIAELSQRISMKRKKSLLVFHTPGLIADYFMERLRHLDREEVFLLMLDNKNRYLGEDIISLGTCNSSPVSNREIFKIALKNNASGIVLIHNHPSGDSKPSKQDIVITRKLKEASEIMNIPLLDHIIVGDGEYTSFREAHVLT